jgi:hypothetical protein
LAGKNASAGSAGLTDPELDSLIDRLFRNGTISPPDREQIVALIDERTDMSRAEAEETVRQWEGMYKRSMGQNGQNPHVVADRTARAVSKASLWGFAAFLISAIAAALGGVTGIPLRPINVTRSNFDSRVNMRVPPTPQ